MLGRAGCSKVAPYTLRRYACFGLSQPLFTGLVCIPVLVRWCHCVLDCQSSGKGVYLLITNRHLGIWHTGVLLWVGLQGNGPYYIVLGVGVHLAPCGNLQ